MTHAYPDDVPVTDEMPSLLYSEVEKFGVGRALIFGSVSKGLLDVLVKIGWTGVLVVKPGDDVRKIQGFESIEGYVGPDSKFSRLLSGCFVRVFTVEEVFRQFSNGSFNLIAACGSGMDRRIWWNESVQASLPKLYLIEEDGHNEDAIKWAKDRGYRSMIVDGMLVMVKE